MQHLQKTRGRTGDPALVGTFQRVFPTYPLSFHTIAHSFAATQNSTLLFSGDSALFGKNTRGGGTSSLLRTLHPIFFLLRTSGYHRALLGIPPLLCFPIEDTMRHSLRVRSFLPYLLISLLPFLLPVLATPQENQPTIRFVRNPDPAPDFKLTGLDGKPVTLADSHGRVILLNFWATWCGPCRAEIPDLVELQNKYKDQLQILGLVVDDDDQDAIKEFSEKFGINYPVAIATNDLRLQYGGIAALPTSFVLDAEGRIVQKHEGLRDPVLYETEIRALLGLPIGNVKVETFEDTGQIFLKNAERATELPGVDLSKLTPEQKISALHKFNAETCNCGCTFTLAHPAPSKSAPAAPPVPAPSTQPAASPAPEKPHD